MTRDFMVQCFAAREGDAMPTYKNEATGSWYCAFYYTDWLGNRKKKKKEGFKTQREAKTFERQFIEKAEASPTCPLARWYPLHGRLQNKTEAYYLQWEGVPHQHKAAAFFRRDAHQQN